MNDLLPLSVYQKAMPTASWRIWLYFATALGLVAVPFGIPVAETPPIDSRFDWMIAIGCVIAFQIVMLGYWLAARAIGYRWLRHFYHSQTSRPWTVPSFTPRVIGRLMVPRQVGPGHVYFGNEAIVFVPLRRPGAGPAVSLRLAANPEFETVPDTSVGRWLRGPLLAERLRIRSGNDRLELRLPYASQLAERLTAHYARPVADRVAPPADPYLAAAMREVDDIVLENFAHSGPA
jgi:hypothetical protein